MKKILLAILIIATLATFAFANGGKEEESGPKTITVWDFKYEEEVSGGAFKTMDKMFMERNPNIVINQVAQPEAEVYSLAMAAITAKTDVDVMLTHTDNRGWNLADYFTTLDDYMGSDLDAYAGAAIDACSNEEGIKMLPVTSQGLGIYYNKANFAKAGLDPDKAPVSWNDFLAACEALDAAGITPFIMGNQGGAFGIDFLYRVILATFYGEGINGFADGTANFSDPEFLEATKMIKTLFDMGYVNSENHSIPYFMDGIETFKAGKGGFFCGLTSDIAHWKDFGDALGYENVGYFPAPVSDKAKFPKAQVNQGAGIALASISYSDEVAESVMYMKAFTSGDIAKVFMDASGAIVPNTTVPVDSSNTMLADILDRMGNNGTPDIMTRIPGGLVSDYDNNLLPEFFLAEELTIDEFIAKLQKMYESFL